MSQAVAAPSTGDVILAPGKSVDLASASRRGVLTGLAIVPAAVIPQVAAGAIPARTLRSAWSDALRDYRLADAAYSAFLANVHNPAQSELNRLAPMPRRRVTATTRSGRTETFTYANDPDAFLSLRTVEGRKAGEQLTAEWVAWDAKFREHSRRLRIDAIEEEDDRLYDAWRDAEDRLMQTPSPDAAAVLTKLEIIWSKECERQEENERILQRDLRLLATLPVGQNV